MILPNNAPIKPATAPPTMPCSGFRPDAIAKSIARGIATLRRKNITIGNVAEAAAESDDTPTIEFYSKIDCPNCDKARNYLEDKGLSFDEIVIEEDTVGADEMQEEFGHTNVPTIKIGETSLSGYSEKMLSRVLKNSGFDIGPEEGAE